MFSSVCSSPQQGFHAEAHKLCRHVDAKISVLGPTLTFLLCCGPGWDLHWHQLSSPILLQPSFVPGKCPRMGNAMGLFLGSCVLMQGEAAPNRTSRGEVQVLPSTSLQGADFGPGWGEQGFPFPAESQLEWALLHSPPQSHFSWIKPGSSRRLNQPPLPCCWEGFTNPPPSPSMGCLTWL